MKRYLIILQLYIHSKSYIDTLLESQVVDVYDRLYPSLKRFKVKDDIKFAETVIRSSKYKGELANKLAVLEISNKNSRKNNYDDDKDKDKDDDNNDENMILLREQMEKTVARERQENWKKMQRKLEQNFEKEFESLMLENINNSEGQPPAKINNINIPMSRNKDKGNGVDANFGEDGLKKNGAAK